MCSEETAAIRLSPVFLIIILNENRLVETGQSDYLQYTPHVVTTAACFECSESVRSLRRVYNALCFSILPSAQSTLTRHHSAIHTLSYADDRSYRTGHTCPSAAYITVTASGAIGGFSVFPRGHVHVSEGTSLLAMCCMERLQSKVIRINGKLFDF